MLKKTAAFALCSIVLLFTVGAFAQTVTGTLSGHVTDKTGAVIPNVKVTAINNSTGGIREAVTNSEGFYQINFVPIGAYDVSVEQTGFRKVKKQAVLIELNKDTVSDFALDVATVTQEVQVESGEVPLIDLTSGEIKDTLDETRVQATPLAGRNFISLVEQVPGFQPAAFDNSSNNPTNSTGSYVAFNGQGTRSATFQIDGVNNDDSSENQNRQGVNISTIKEFQVLTNGYSAEFGRAGGAVVLVQTKSGTNGFHGDGYDFIQNDILNANDWFTNASNGKRPIVRRNQYGGTLGGPVLKNKLFFFGSVERLKNVAGGSMSRFIWLPTDGPRPCNVGEKSAPKGPYCVDPTTHPNINRDMAFMRRVMGLWNTPELQGKAPNDPAACSQVIQSGRVNRCVRVAGLSGSQPTSDYTGRMDWNTSSSTTMNARYQYSRQIVQSPRLILGDNFGTNNNRQYNLGYTLTKVWSPRQTGEFRYGYGNRNTNQQVVDGTDANGQVIPILRFGAPTLVDPSLSSDTLNFGGTIIGTSANVPINRYQRDHQVVYNHTLVISKHTLRAGIDERFQALDDIANGTNRGFWTFGTFNTTAEALAGTGFTGWEMFLSGMQTSYQQGFGDPSAQNRFGETNTYLEDSWRVKQNLTLNLGLRWEGVRAPHEIKNRFNYGYGGDFNNFEPRVGFAWSPGSSGDGWTHKLLGNQGDSVIRGGMGIYHDRIFQSIFSQSGLNFRLQPPNGFLLGALTNATVCPTNPGTALVTPSRTTQITGTVLEISDPSCGFVFTGSNASRTVEVACSLTAAGCNGVKVAGGQLLTSLLLPDKNFHLPYVTQWNLTVERKLPSKMALSVSYNGNRGIGLPFFSGINDSQFGIKAPLVRVDVGGGNFQNVVFDRVCQDFSDPICMSATGTPGTSGSLRSFSSLTDATATLAQKGIVVVNGVPHGYISLSTPRTAERRPDGTNGRNVLLSNFAYTYYNALVTKVTRQTSNGFTMSGWWTWSKTMDTGSESTFTGTDTNAPIGVANPQASLRALSSFHQTHRVVISGSYELPWMRAQQGVLGRLLGGYTVSGVTTFASGLPYTIVVGSDLNLDGVGSDLPSLADPRVLFASVDAGRPIPNSLCPSALIAPGRCPDSQSQNQVSAAAFLPSLTDLSRGDRIPLAPGQNSIPGAIRRNSFFEQGQINTDAALAKNVRIAENVGLSLRLELFNLFNRTEFGIPARTINSSTPLSRLTGTLNLFNYVNSARPGTSARVGQFAIRLTF